MSSKFELIKT